MKLRQVENFTVNNDHNHETTMINEQFCLLSYENYVDSLLSFLKWDAQNLNFFSQSHLNDNDDDDGTSLREFVRICNGYDETFSSVGTVREKERELQSRAEKKNMNKLTPWGFGWARQREMWSYFCD